MTERSVSEAGPEKYSNVMTFQELARNPNYYFPQDKLTIIEYVPGAKIEAGPIGFGILTLGREGEEDTLILKKEGSNRIYAEIPKITLEDYEAANLDGLKIPEDKRLIVGTPSSFEVTLAIAEEGISPRHFLIAQIEGTNNLIVRDLGSENGTQPGFENGFSP